MYIIENAGTGEAKKQLTSGSGTYTINIPEFTYDASMQKDDILFELDGLENGAIFKVTDVTFTSTGWHGVPKNTDFTPDGTPWTLHAANDQSTPGEEQLGNMSY